MCASGRISFWATVQSMGRNVISWTAASLLLSCILQHIGDVNGQFGVTPPTCPSDTITFRCTIAGDSNGVTIWRVGGSSARCVLLHGDQSDTSTCGPGGVFTARFYNITPTSFSTTLSVTASAPLDGTLVECFGPASTLNAANMVGSGILQIVGRPSLPSLSCVELSEDTDGTVGVTVCWTLSGGDSADFYFINITTNDPDPPYGGLLNISNASVTQRELTGLQAGYEYNITVHGVNCGSQEGSESEPLTITPEVPRTPLPNVYAEYDGMTGTLQTINITWNEMDSVIVSADCANGQNIGGSYEISYTNSSGVFITTCVVNGTDCSNGVCHHELRNNITDSRCQPPVLQFNGGNVTVTVTARNVVGRSSPAVSSSIGATNNILGVMISFPATVQLQCTFLSGFTGSAHCRVIYGTDPNYMNLPYSAESNETGTAGESVSVVLREQLNSSTVYYYTVSANSGDVTVVVQGFFVTPKYNCPLNELQTSVSPLDHIYPQCQQNQDTVTTVSIPNGAIFVTCYSGGQFVSGAFYVCDEGYQPNVSSNVSSSVVRVCRGNGLWSGTTIACDIVPTTLGSSASELSTGATVGITAVVTGTTILVIGVLAGILVYHCVNNYRSQKSQPKLQTGPNYEPTSNVELSENLAYGPVQNIELRKNVAYEHARLQH